MYSRLNRGVLVFRNVLNDGQGFKLGLITYYNTASKHSLSRPKAPRLGHARSNCYFLNNAEPQTYSWRLNGRMMCLAAQQFMTRILSLVKVNMTSLISRQNEIKLYKVSREFSIFHGVR